MTRRSVLTLLTAAAAAFVACDDGISPDPNLVIYAERTTLNVGDTLQLVTISFHSPGSDTPPQLKWSSSESTIARVSASGLVTARHPGSVLIGVMDGELSDTITLAITDIERSGEFVGVVHQGFETSTIVPCGERDAWWVSGVGLAFRDARMAGMHDVMMRVRATVTTEGRYGHVGAYGREIRVTEVLDVRGLARRGIRMDDQRSRACHR